MKFRPFKLLILFFLWLEVLNFDNNFFLALLKKILGLKFLNFFFGPIEFFFFFFWSLNMPRALVERLLSGLAGTTSTFRCPY
jgi:hypothetical protein